jgi:hypothetical protein
MLSIDALDAVYPDARFVMTHRDVRDVLPSVCALYTTLTGALTDRLDPAAIGTHNREIWRTGLRRLIAFRDAGNEERFVDLAFDAVQHDPIGQVTHLYEQLGDELTDEARRRMESWWADSTRNRSGPGNYRADDFGLDAGTIAGDFAFYHDRFGLSTLPAGP